MRETTERPEAAQAGTVRLVGTGVEAIEGALAELLTDPEACRRMSIAHNPYGDGRACGRVIETLAQFFASSDVKQLEKQRAGAS